MSRTDLCDSDIRPFLRQRIETIHAGQSFMLLDEFPLYGGDVRADLVALNGTMHGYEIKSAKDTLDRLPRQVSAYRAVFDRASLVVSECHLDPAREVLPDWWEILVAQCVGGGVCFKAARRGRANPERDGVALAALLWKAEALAMLASLGLDTGMRTATMAEMMETLVAKVRVGKLSELVRQKLKARGDWLTAARQKRGGEKSQPPATPYRRQRTPYSRSPGYTRLPN